MRVKEIYSTPRIEVIPMQTENLLETISLPVNNNSSDSGGDAKGGSFDEEDEAHGQSMAGYEPWQE